MPSRVVPPQVGELDRQLGILRPKGVSLFNGGGDCPWGVLGPLLMLSQVDPAFYLHLNPVALGRPGDRHQAVFFESDQAVSCVIDGDLGQAGHLLVRDVPGRVLR